MSTTANAIYVVANGHHVALDLDDDTELLPSFQANDRTKPDSIQADYSPEFSVPGTARNHRLLQHAAASQPAQGSAYVRVPAVLTSGGVETLPLALLYLKGFSEGRYNLQLFGGNRRLVEALGDKTLADLDLSRFDHDWVPATILAALPYDYWAANGWGYEIYDRGKALDLVNVNPYDLYPSCRADLVWTQILTDAGFTADSLLAEPLWAQLNVPSANPFTFSQDYRDARALKAGLPYNPVPASTDLSDIRKVGVGHEQEFVAEKLPFTYTASKPFVGPTKALLLGSTYVADALGFYDLSATAQIRYGCRGDLPGQVSCKVLLYVNGQPVYDALGVQIGVDEHRITDNTETDGGDGYMTRTFSPKLERFLLKPNDFVEVWWQGDEWITYNLPPTDPYWQLGPVKGAAPSIHLPDGRDVLTGSNFTVTMLDEFPPGGRVHLNEWLPKMKQLDFVKAMMLVMSLTIQADQYTPHLRLAPGNKLLPNVAKAKDWTAKRDAAAVPGRVPERDLAFRFGEYGQVNNLKWEEDENVTTGYADGTIAVADEVLEATYDIATLPFAATESSKQVLGLLRIINFEAEDLAATPIKYSRVEAKPRLTLRPPVPAFYGQLTMIPAIVGQLPGMGTPAVMASYVSVASYFDGVDLSLELNKTVLTTYWADLRAMLDQSRYLTENYRLTPQDIAELDFSVPIWDGLLGDYFAVSQVSEYDARRPVEVKLCRLNAAHLGPPRVPGAGLREWYSAEWYAGEWF